MVPKSWRRQICSCCVFVLSFSRLKIIFFDFIFVRTFFSSLVCICFSRINAIHAIRRQQQQHTTKKSNLFFFHLNSHTQFHLNVKIRNSERNYYRSRGHSHTHTMNWLKTDWTINAQTHTVCLCDTHFQCKDEEYSRLILTLIEIFLNPRWVITGCFIVCKAINCLHWNKKVHTLQWEWMKIQRKAQTIKYYEWTKWKKKSTTFANKRMSYK